MREIGDDFGIGSPNGVMCHLSALERKGLVSREPNLSRAITLSTEPPFKGACRWPGGSPPACCTRRSSKRADRLRRAFRADKNLFVLEVHGDSMIEDQIADGDYVVIRKQRGPRSGQIVVALTDEKRSHAQTLVPRENRIRLEPANATMKPIYVKNAKVLGVVVGVVRGKTSADRV